MKKKPTETKLELIKSSSPLNIQGHVERVYKNNIVGWVQFKDDITQSVDIDVYSGDDYLETISADQITESIGVENCVGY